MSLAGSAYRGESRTWRALALVLGLWALAATAVVVWQALSVPEAVVPDAIPVERTEDLEEDDPVELADALDLQPVRFSDLPGWQADPVSEALPAFLRSCARMRFRGSRAVLSPVEVGGTVADWLLVCNRAAALRLAADAEVRSFFETAFVPLRASNHDDGVGLFTGYYEPILRGSRKRSERYTVPIYRPPGDIVQVDLGEFRQDLAGRRVAGRLVGNRLRPYADRAEISAGAISGRNLELAWTDDPIATFFLHIQGSGRIELEDGGTLRVGYASQNGHPYFAIGRELVRRGALTLEEVSLQSIRAWLESHPEDAAEVMATNASYVFFRQLDGDGPIGSEGVALTPRRSLAVDRSFLPLGAPIWLDTTAPDPEGEGETTLQRLVVAQDTGGAIRGPVRGDVFWGAGVDAEEIAGRMRSQGRYWLLLPAPLAERALARDR